MTLTDRLHALAEHLGVAVSYHHGGLKGLYVAESRLITLREGMGWRKLRSTFAHELGHAINDDQPIDDPILRLRQERRADEIAAQLLIAPCSYLNAEKTVGHHPGALAIELGVTTHIIQAWRDLHERKLTP